MASGTRSSISWGPPGRSDSISGNLSLVICAISFGFRRGTCFFVPGFGNPLSSTALASLPGLSPSRRTITAGTKRSAYELTADSNTPSGFWRLGETTGSAADASGNGHTGTSSSPGIPTLGVAGGIAGDTSKAATFDGTNDVIDAGNLGAGESSTYSVEAWIKTTSSATGKMIVGEADSTSGAQAFAGLQSDQTTGTHARFLVVDDSGATGSVVGSTVINDGQWHQLLGVRNGTSFRLYVDGALDGSSSKTFTHPISLDTTTIGARKRSTTGAYFSGTIDEPAFYPTALSASQANSHYRTGVLQPTYSTEATADAPTAYWRLGESSGSAADASGHSNTGSYVNTPTLSTTGAIAGDTDTAVTFDGSTEYVNAGDVSAGESSTYTVEAWTKTTATAAPSEMIAGEANSASMSVKAYAGLQTDATDGSHARFIVVDDANATASVTGSKVINDGQWHHIVGVRNGTSFKLFVDGALDGTMTKSLTTITLDTTTIGARKRFALGAYFAGTIDEVAFYPTTLPASQINAHYQAGLNIKPILGTYAYNGDGLRASKTVSGDHYTIHLVRCRRSSTDGWGRYEELHLQSKRNTT